MPNPNATSWKGTNATVVAPPAWNPDSDSLSNTVTDIIMKGFYITIGSVGILNNGLVLCIMCRLVNTRKRNTTLFIVNQSVVDLLTAVFLLMMTVLPSDGRLFQSVADDVYCRLWIGRVPFWLCIHCSTFNLVALTLERYVSVVHPINHKISFTRTKVCIAIATTWSMAILLDMLNLLTAYIEDGVCKLYMFNSLTDMKIRGIFGASINYFIPVFVLIYCYTRMAYSLRRKVTPLLISNQASNVSAQVTVNYSHQQNSVKARGRRNVIKTLAIVSTAFIICTSWNQWFFFLFNLGVFDYTDMNSTFYHFSVIAMFANCCVNPFIYAAKYEEFQNELRRLFCRHPVNITPSSTEGTHSGHI